MTRMIATANGNGPYFPVIVLGDRRFVQGQTAFEEMSEAIERAIQVIADIRDAERSPGFDAILASLPDA